MNSIKTISFVHVFSEKQDEQPLQDQVLYWLSRTLICSRRKSGMVDLVKNSATRLYTEDLLLG